MKFLGIGLICSIIILALFSLLYSSGMVIKIFNQIVNAYQNTQESVANLDTEYQRRYALVDNLVKIVKETKGFEQYVMNFEKEAYIQVAEAKASATKLNIAIPEEIKNKIKKENDLTNIISILLDKLLVMAQHYPQISDPQLKDHQETIKSLQQLRQELKDIEQNILNARKELNQFIKIYNVQINIFPANIIAKIQNYNKLDFFEIINEEVKKDVKIQF